ncbi:MAG: patatin-like phospholipase family protein [Candidatus Paceibacterota bacterium]
MIPNFTPTKIGVIKSGGVVNGSFGVGAYRVLSKCLEQHGLKVSKVIANSAQAFSVLLESVGKFNEISQIWLELTADQVFKFHYWDTPLNPLRRGAILDSSPLRKNVGIWSEGYLDQIVSDQATPFEIIATNFKTGEPMYLPNQPKYRDRLVDISMASAGLIPFLGPTVVEICGEQLILGDGAFSDDMPLKRLVDEGCDLIFVIDAYGGDVSFYDLESLSWPDLLTRGFEIMSNHNSRRSIGLNEQRNATIAVLDHLRTELIKRYGPDSDAANMAREAKGILGLHGMQRFKLVWIKSVKRFRNIGLRDINPENMKNAMELGYWSAKLAMHNLGLDSDKV